MFGFFGGKPCSKFGKWLDNRGITQVWIVNKTKIRRNTISKIASGKDYEPKLPTIKKIMRTVKEIDPNAKPNDFFDI